MDTCAGVYLHFYSIKCDCYHCPSLRVSRSLSRNQPLLLQVLLTDDHSAASKDSQATSSCLIKLSHLELTSACPPMSTAGPAPGGSPRNIRRSVGPCSDFRRPLSPPPRPLQPHFLLTHSGSGPLFKRTNTTLVILLFIHKSDPKLTHPPVV